MQKIDNPIIFEKMRLSFFDVDALHPALTDSNFYLQQVGGGIFEADLFTARLGSGILDRAYYSKAILSQGAVNNKLMVFGCVLKCGKPGRLNGQTIGAYDMILADEGAAIDYLSEEETVWTTIQFRREDLEQFGITTREDGRVYYIEGDRETALALERVFHQITAGDKALPDGEKAYDEILSLFVNRIESGKGPRAIETKPLARQIYHYINAYAATPLQMSDLTKLTGKSERTLERVFKHHFGVTPYRYLKLHRLNQAHKALLDHRKGIRKKTIKKIAMESGFVQMGYFSAEYKKLFGETPSQTIGR